MDRILRGYVRTKLVSYFVVECPDAPPHLRTMNLTAWEIGTARVGDVVDLEYRTTPSYGLWMVTRVHPKTE